jgi:hypothetical protein
VGRTPGDIYLVPGNHDVQRASAAQLLARTFGEDVFTCDRCGGPRRVVACVFSATIAAPILDHLGIPSRPLPLARAQDPPQLPLYA